MIEQLKLKLQILIIQLKILLLQQQLTVPNLSNPKMIIIHHEGGWLNFNEVNEYHKQKWGFKSSLGCYIGYQYFIDRLGIIHQGRRDNEEGAHTVGINYPAHYLNRNSIGICLMGNGEEQPFTEPQIDSMWKLINEKLAQYNLTKNNIFGHKDFTNTLCPSTDLYKKIVNYKKVV